MCPVPHKFPAQPSGQLADVASFSRRLKHVAALARGGPSLARQSEHLDGEVRGGNCSQTHHFNKSSGCAVLLGAQTFTTASAHDNSRSRRLAGHFDLWRCSASKWTFARASEGQAQPDASIVATAARAFCALPALARRRLEQHMLQSHLTAKGATRAARCGMHAYK